MRSAETGMIRPTVPSDQSRQRLEFGSLIRQLLNRVRLAQENGRRFIAARILFVRFESILFNPGEYFFGIVELIELKNEMHLNYNDIV